MGDMLLGRTDPGDVLAFYHGDLPRLPGWLDTPLESALSLLLTLPGSLPSPLGHEPALTITLSALELELANHIQSGIASRRNPGADCLRHLSEVLLGFGPKHLLPTRKRHVLV
jgi:hypothetical protein